jgi:hypothetical protein
MSRVILVKDPVKVGGGVTPFVLYRVASKLEGEGIEVTVDRRYSDFAWLLERLRYEHRGCIVPPLPPKSLTNMDDGFVESRRRGLQRFLNRVSTHPQLSASVHFNLFLTASDASLAEVRNKSLEKLSAAVEGVNWLNSMASSLLKKTSDMAVDALGSSSTAVSKEEDPLEVKLREVAAVETIRKAAAAKAQRCAALSAESAVALSRLGQSLSMLSQAEEESSLRTLMQESGGVLTSVGAVQQSFAQMDAELFEEPVAEAAGMAEATRIVFQNRSDAKKEVHDTLQRCSAKAQEITAIDIYKVSDEAYKHKYSTCIYFL